MVGVAGGASPTKVTVTPLAPGGRGRGRGRVRVSVRGQGVGVWGLG